MLTADHSRLSLSGVKLYKRCDDTSVYDIFAMSEFSTLCTNYTFCRPCFIYDRQNDIQNRKCCGYLYQCYTPEHECVTGCCIKNECLCCAVWCCLPCGTLAFEYGRKDRNDYAYIRCCIEVLTGPCISGCIFANANEPFGPDKKESIEEQSEEIMMLANAFLVPGKLDVET